MDDDKARTPVLVTMEHLLLRALRAARQAGDQVAERHIRAVLIGVRTQARPGCPRQSRYTPTQR